MLIYMVKLSHTVEGLLEALVPLRISAVAEFQVVGWKDRLESHFLSQYSVTKTALHSHINSHLHNPQLQRWPKPPRGQQ